MAREMGMDPNLLEGSGQLDVSIPIGAHDRLSSALSVLLESVFSISG